MPGNQGSGGNKKGKGKGRGKGKKDKGKGKAHETHVADTAMVIDINSETKSGACDDAVEETSDVTWTPEYAAPNLLQGKPGESSSSVVTAICIDEEVLDWGDDNDNGMGTIPSTSNQSFCRMSF